MGPFGGGGGGSVTSFVIAGFRARGLALDLSCGNCCPPFVMRKAYTNRRLQYHTKQELSHALTVLIVPLGAPDALLPSHLLRALDGFLLARGVPIGAGPCFLTPFCSCSAASSAPSRVRVTGV